MLSAVLSPGAFGSVAQPHFDFHFHTGDRARVEAIAPGRGGEQPEAFQRAGYYPTQYCVRQDRVGRRAVSLERFRYSEAF